MRADRKAGTIFDIERGTYAIWNAELERLGTRFMLTAHTHNAEIVPPNGGLLPHAYPLVVGSEYRDGRFLGAALTVGESRLTVVFNDKEQNAVKEYTLDF